VRSRQWRRGTDPAEEGRNGYFDPKPGSGDDTLIFDCGVTTPTRQVHLSLTFSLSLTPSLSLSLSLSLSPDFDLCLARSVA
jgi:hypothetical protein